jgi:hypothetical protein
MSRDKRRDGLSTTTAEWCFAIGPRVFDIESAPRPMSGETKRKERG